MLEIRKASNNIQFSGSVNISNFADRQKGPTCGFEAIENIIQLFHNVPNNLVETDLYQKAYKYGALRSNTNGYILDIGGFQPILMNYGIPSYWYPFDHLQVIVPALYNNRGVLVIGEGNKLNNHLYHQKGIGHAFVLTNFYTDASECFILGYVGIDSNVEGVESIWPYQNIESAAQWAISQIGYSVLITGLPVNHPSKAKYYKLTESGSIIPVPY